jgi:hypothetical protein
MHGQIFEPFAQGLADFFKCFTGVPHMNAKRYTVQPCIASTGFGLGSIVFLRVLHQKMTIYGVIDVHFGFMIQ